MDGFRLTPNDMTRAARELEQYAQNILDTVNRIERTSAELSGGWEGAGYNQFDESIKSYSDAAKKMADVLETNSKALISSAQLAEDTSATLERQWS